MLTEKTQAIECYLVKEATFYWQCSFSFCSPCFIKNMIFDTHASIISYLFASLPKMTSWTLSPMLFCLIMQPLTDTLTSFSPFLVINYYICDSKHKWRVVVLSKKVLCFLLSRFLNFLIPWTNSLLVHLCDSQCVSDTMLWITCIPGAFDTLGHNGWVVWVRELLGVWIRFLIHPIKQGP